MKVGTDAILLGCWVETKPDDVVLDIGTGCGLLPLMLSQKGVAQVDAVDIDEASIEEATINFEASRWRDHMQAICADINNFTPDYQYDLMVSNPPFFNRYSKCDSERKSRARHNDVTLSYEALCAVAKRLLKPDGRFALVLPANMSDEFLKAAEKGGLFIQKCMNVIPIEGRDANRVNLELGFVKPLQVVEETFTIRDADNRFTAQYNTFVHDFYLG